MYLGVQAVVAPTPINYLTARPDLGAIRPYVPIGSWKRVPVSITAISFGLIVVSVTLNKSNPADPLVPLRGNIDISSVLVKTTESNTNEIHSYTNTAWKQCFLFLFFSKS
jgi:hypothetical protein